MSGKVNPGAILVTGGAGFIGSATIRHLLAATDAVIVNLDKLTYAANRAAIAEFEKHPRYRFVRACITDREALRAVFARHRPVAVMHLAAESHVDRSIDGPSDFITTNVVGTSVLLETAREYLASPQGRKLDRFRFHHVSTDEVFGSLGPEGRFSEASPYAPRSPYAASKAASDHLVRAWHETYGIPVVLSNCCNNYGPWQFPEKLIPLMIVKALGYENLPVYGRGEHIRDWLHVEDHARALHLILTRGRPGESYNVGADCEKRNIEVVEAVCDLVDDNAPARGRPRRRELITFVADRPGHDLRYAIDAGKLRSDLGWRPRESFAAGLAGTVRWYLDQAEWWRNIDSYRGDRLGLGAMAEAAAS
ncbi:MAG TPA: dTDP-glucose 4,6-dehydratase [Rhizomicrobium sp.]|jgi:dTDP-glucose 4,6-dehydratase|nr:dTDP-glucose 4,6-dehydratase [Rhizomicrobium sp.]